MPCLYVGNKNFQLKVKKRVASNLQGHLDNLNYPWGLMGPLIQIKHAGIVKILAMV